LKYYIIAGEASGDLHAAKLISEIKKLDHQARVRAWGGNLMAAQGAEVVKHYRDLAFMGFAEVVLNLRTILRNMSFCKSDLLAFKPDVLILVDYPGFNLPIAKFAHKHGIRVHYYISPQVWAWKKGRVHTIKKVVDKMMVILPFEKDFYVNYGFQVDFVGHPLLDAIKQEEIKANDFFQQNKLTEKPLIALLPGSRKQEISRMLQVMLMMVPGFPEYQFVIAGAPSVDLAFYEKFTKGSQIAIVQNQTYPLLRHATAALVTSGTATLETALFGVPQVVCYKGNSISFEIAKRIVKVKYISLVNLIMDREVVTELIQNEMNAYRLKHELLSILHDDDRKKQLALDYKELWQKLGGPGASARAAGIVVGDIQ
jgi:lipid-A-disaccharide synthase